MKKLLLAVLTLSLLVLPFSQITFAANGADWVAGNIIGDGVFANGNAMSVADIQAFLNQKVGTGGSAYATPGFCDVNGTRTSEFGGGTRAQYAASVGRSTPFTCLKDYYEVPKNDPSPGIPANNYGGAPIPAGAQSAAQLIWNAGQRYSINPRVLLVMIQKESAGPLITDDWPFLSQYTYAMGAHCPDSGPGGAANCDSNYAGFSMQIQESARLLRYYITNMDQPWWTYKKLGNNDILYQNSRPECGSSTVNIITRATAALYTYTPYQPNQAALNNLYGTGDACSAYGNRNFWRMFIDWFGSTQTNVPFAWSIVGIDAYLDSGRTIKSTAPTITTSPGGKSYITLKARNIGFETWYPSFIRLGTSNPMDRPSQFYDSSWPAATRPTALMESSVTPGQVGTFQFTLNAPANTGSYREYFNIVAEARTWLNDISLHFNIDVVNPVASSNSSMTALESGQSIIPGDYLLSPDRQSVFILQKDGNLVLYTDYRPVWFTSTRGYSLSRLVMQTDGNLVLYDTANRPLWNSETSGHPGARLVTQTDGNLVVYSSANVPLWASYTLSRPDNLSTVNYSLSSAILFQGQQLETADRKYRLVLQQDGNLVLYSPTRALWATHIYATRPYLVAQSDGNLVLYNSAGQPIWHTQTSGQGAVQLKMQSDGNLVLYNSAGKPLWNTATQGQQ
jgi:hypothetical protein